MNGASSVERRLRPAAGAVLILAMGGFALTAQTLLVRDFLGLFEGNELGVAAFFCAWLLWIAVGSLVGRLRGRWSDGLALRFEWLPLLYLPAFALQHQFIGLARDLVAPAYERVSFDRIMTLALWVNAPVSLITGWLFPMACRWWADRQALPVAAVYLLEVLGSTAGGLAVTAVLAREVPGETVALGAGLALALCALLNQRRAAGRWALLALCVAGGLLVWRHVGDAWARAGNLRAWQRILPADAYAGSFVTPQARYLYGQYGDEFHVLAWHSPCETYPDAEHASEIVALHLAQHPAARRVLVLGPSALSVCRRLLDLPQVESLTWLHPDPDYPRRLLAALSQDQRRVFTRLEIPRDDARRVLDRRPGAYDLAILNLPDATTLVENRYATREFYTLLKHALASNGVAGVRSTGPANYLSGEMTRLGASTYATLREVFRHVAIKPGDETWFLASDGEGLSEQPAVLRERFQTVPGAAAVYPPAGLDALYPTDRIAFQSARYREAVELAPPGFYSNTDTQPRAGLYSLLLTGRQADRPSALAGLLDFFVHAGAGLFLLLIALWGGLRLVYRLRGAARAGARPAQLYASPYQRTDFYFLLFATGFIGLALSLALMQMYQFRFGSLYLHVGWLSALFMLGLFLGGSGVQRALARRGAVPVLLTPIAMLIQIGLLGALGAVPADTPAPVFSLLFLLAGAMNGVYVPLVAWKLRIAGLSSQVAGAWITCFDHLGGALGAWLGGLVLLPVLGLTDTLRLLAALLAVGGLMFIRTAERHLHVDRLDRWTRPLGYLLLGCAGVAVWAAHLETSAQAQSQDLELLRAGRRMRPGAIFEKQFCRSTGQAALPAAYFTAGPPGARDTLYLFNSRAFAPGISGYGGPIEMVVLVDAAGKLVDLEILRDRETPAYLNLCRPWLKTLVGHALFEEHALDEVDAVSGATLSSTTILRTLRAAGTAFAEQALNLSIAGRARPTHARALEWPVVILATGLFLALAARRYPNRLRRRVGLIAVLVVGGLMCNIQYSLHQVFLLLDPSAWRPAPTLAFALMAGVPVVVLLLGNLYCGHLCPFGALQELIGDLRPRAWATDPAPAVWRLGRSVKYLLLFVLVMAFATGRQAGALTADPLTSVFSNGIDNPTFLFAVALLVAAFFFRRFWCRSLCPAGAFLALLNAVKILRRQLPKVHPAQCDLGVRRARELDCIQCDRCRMDCQGLEKPAGEFPRIGIREGLYVLALALSVAALSRFLGRHQPGEAAPAIAAAAVSAGERAGGGRPRTVDMNTIRQQIRGGFLSSHEALYYRRLTNGAPGSVSAGRLQ